MVFDTNETSGIFPQLREDLMVPRALRNILRIPVFSLAADTRDLRHPEGGSLGGGSGSSDDGAVQCSNNNGDMSNIVRRKSDMTTDKNSNDKCLLRQSKSEPNLNATEFSKVHLNNSKAPCVSEHRRPPNTEQ